LAQLGDLSDDDLFRTFNMGVGFALLVPVDVADGVVTRARELGEGAMRIGVVRPGAGQTRRLGTWRDISR